MRRKRQPQSEFDRFMGYRIYPYYLFSWIVFMIFGISSIIVGNAYVGIMFGFPLFFLIFLSLVGTDYIAFRIYGIAKKKWLEAK